MNGDSGPCSRFGARVAVLELVLRDAMTATGTAILVLFDRAAFPANMFALAPEVSLVAGGAERRVLGRRPRERGRHTAAVAVETPGVSSVVARVVALRVMAEDRGFPGIGGMATIALHSRAQMVSRFGSRSAAIIVVALIASAGTAGIVSPRAADEGGGGMAKVTVGTCRDVGVMFADGRHAMAGRAIVHDPGVIEDRADESSRVVTDAAIFDGRDMRGRLALGKPGAMA